MPLQPQNFSEDANDEIERVAAAAFVAMVTWRWGRKATFAAYAARSSLTMAELVQIHRAGTTFIERNALIMAPNPLRHPDDHAPALVSLLLERYGILPRNLILVGVQNSSAFARPFALPPGTPADRVRILHDAFHATLKDPQFLAEAKKAKLAVDPITGSEMKQLVADVFKLDAAMVAKLKSALY